MAVTEVHFEDTKLCELFYDSPFVSQAFIYFVKELYLFLSVAYTDLEAMAIGSVYATDFYVLHSK